MPVTFKSVCAILGVGALVGGLALAQASCASTPVSIPVRTFDRPNKVAVVCMEVLDEQGRSKPAVPVEEANCAPVPSGVDGRHLRYHLYALVTQTARGEIAVVDLTGGFVVDEDRSTPGINFIPVGGQPRDVTVSTGGPAHAGKLTFVTSVELNKWAIYAIPNESILGDSQGLPGSQTILTLPQLPVCQLPQPPTSINAVRRGDSYELVVVLGPSAGAAPKVIVLDPGAFERALLNPPPPSTPDAPVFERGQLRACADAITAAIELSPAVPSSWIPGPRWDDGVKYVDGGAPPGTGSVDWCSASPPGPDGGAPAASPIDTHLLEASRPTFSAFDPIGNFLFVGDGARPIIHVVDLSQEEPRELEPLVAASALNPAELVEVGQLAVSPPTSDFRRYLYAVDQGNGSIMVFDVTDPTSPESRTPLQRPHPELNPFQPPDRIVFDAPVKSVTFVQHDWPLTRLGDLSIPGNRLEAAVTGAICNPNPNIVVDGTTGRFTPSDAFGAYYRNNVDIIERPVEPLRLRGIFGFAVLANGFLAAIDVDDWDAPCRRPDPMTQEWRNNALQIPQPAPGPSDFDPYHAPFAWTGGDSPVTNEAFFPVSQPHRERSAYLLRRDPTTGTHIPTLVGRPQLLQDGAPKPTTGPDGARFPFLSPTLAPECSLLKADPSFVVNPTEPNPASRNLDPNLSELNLPDAPGPDGLLLKLAASRPGDFGPNVRFSWEDPTVHEDQDWVIAYEGKLPNFEGVVGSFETDDGYMTMTLRADSGQFCRRGVEDWALAQQRIDAQLPEYGRLGIAPPLEPKTWTGDYIQITDDLLPADDPYWRTDDPLGCWDFAPDQRRSICEATFGPADDRDNYPSRDFPILEAYDDRLRIGRFGGPGGGIDPTPLNRTIVGPDPSNVPFLKALRCCFHNQVHFDVRTGGQWLAWGSVHGYLHHVTSDATGRCVQSSDPREQLLNARAPDLRRDGNPIPPDRYSPLAMRNPLFSFIIWRGVRSEEDPVTDHTVTQRGLEYRMQTQGRFEPLRVDLNPNSAAINPSAVQFIPSLGQIAVIDGAVGGQGLILIDLNTLRFAHDPYF